MESYKTLKEVGYNGLSESVNANVKNELIFLHVESIDEMTRQRIFHQIVRSTGVP